MSAERARAQQAVTARGRGRQVMYKLYGAPWSFKQAKNGRHIYSQSSPSTAFDLTAGAGSVSRRRDCHFADTPVYPY